MALLRSLFRKTEPASPAFAQDAKPLVAPATSRSIAEARGEPPVEEVHRLAGAGRLGEALALADAALASTPEDSALLLARGSTLFEWGRYHEALTWFGRAEALGSVNFNLYLRAGWACLWTVGGDAAEPWMRKAIAADPGEWTGHFGLASALRGQGKSDEAVASLEAALELAPDNLHCLAQLSDCMLSRNRPDAAEKYARRAIAASPSSPSAWTNLGVALVSQDRFHEAKAAFEHAARMETVSGEVADQHVNLANCLRELGDLPKALQLYEQRLRANPSAALHVHYAHALFTAGRLSDGWVEYEFRWLHPPLLSLRAPFRKPVWDGQSLRGRTILLRTEQGIGDVIQLIRYAPHVKALGAAVLLEVRRGVGDLAKGFPGIDRILVPAEPYPEFDFFVHLASLPRVFGTELASVPAIVPYLNVEPGRRARWSSRLEGEGFKVGIVWAGEPNHVRDRYRSLSLAALSPLAEVEGVRLYSLQKGKPADQLATVPVGANIRDLGPDLHDFADTAAAVAALDLVISVDTSVAHLAGALAKPVWVLLPTPAEWRWMNEREDSPWYPTMRLFRQRRMGEWPEVIGRVKEALGEEVRRRESPGQFDPGHATHAVTASAAKNLVPAERPRHSLPRMTAVAETVAGIVQYVPDEPIVGESITWYGEYLQAHVMLLGRLIRPGGTLMEVNAGVGLHALCIAPIVDHVFLYEARPLFQQVLRQNLAANRVANVTVMKRGLAGSDMTAVMGIDANGDASRPDNPGGATDTIDDLRLERLDWLKLNDAVAPIQVIQGAAQSLWRLRPRLFVAVRDEGSAREVAACANDFGYRCWRIEHAYFNPQNFNRRETDIFSSRTALAVLALPEEGEAMLDGYGEFPR